MEHCQFVGAIQCKIEGKIVEEFEAILGFQTCCGRSPINRHGAERKIARRRVAGVAAERAEQCWRNKHKDCIDCESIEVLCVSATQRSIIQRCREALPHRTELKGVKVCTTTRLEERLTDERFIRSTLHVVMCIGPFSACTRPVERK